MNKQQFGKQQFNEEKENGFINNDYLIKINTFCEDIEKKKESRYEIRRFFSEHPKAEEILTRQILRENNHSILVLHRILNIKINENLLIQSLRGQNLSEENCVLLHEMYYYRLISDISRITDIYASSDDRNRMIYKSQAAAQYRIIEKDWDLYEQKKYHKCIIKERISDVTRLRRQAEKVPEFLCRIQKDPDFIIVLDIDNFFMCEETESQINFNVRLSNDPQLPMKPEKIKQFVNFLQRKKHTVIIAQKDSKSVHSIYEKHDLFNEMEIYNYLELNIDQVLEKHNRKRCFILKKDTAYKKVSQNCFFVNLERIASCLFNEVE